jgi:acid phosphatase family membrane protein YuiD|tara:strand:+ start:5637 stop:6089 length:453 start_codon:yes stop_codon:yes gene_type:complete
VLELGSFLQDTPIWGALIASLVAQVFKVGLVLVTERRWAFDRLLDTGGMPSSHSAAVTALAVNLGLVHGWQSPYFAIAAVFASIVMYDATGIRRAAGLHAKMINQLVNELAHLFDEGFRPQALKTLLGHTYPQVIVGSLIGAACGFLLAM